MSTFKRFHSCSVVNQLEMLQRTAIKNRPDLKKKTPTESEFPTILELLSNELECVSSVAKEMLEGCAAESSSTCPDSLK